MKRLNCIELVLALASLTVATGKMGAAPVGTTFTYQGRLADGGGPVGQQRAKTAGVMRIVNLLPCGGSWAPCP